MKFYRYVIYKLFSWAKRRPNDTPVANVVLTMSFVHLIHFYILFILLDKFFGLHFLVNIDKKVLYIVLPVFPILYYFLFYSKKRWDGYINEFASESKIESFRGKFYVIAYLLGSIILFFASLIIVYGI